MKSYGGLIRWKFGIPLGLMALALVLYTYLLLDQQLRWVLQKVATDANGAEVNIQSLKTSISGLFVEIQGIQVTDPEAPEFNRIEFGKLRFDLGAQGLLRGKVVVEDASLQDIQIRSKRLHPGKVLPPPPVEPAGPGMKEKAMELLQPLKDEVVQNALGVLKEKGFENPLKDINWEEMPSRVALKQLENDWNQRQQTLEQLLGTLPKADEFNQIRAELKSIKTPEDPSQIQASIAHLEALKARVQGNISRVAAAAQQFTTEANLISTRIQGLDDFVKADIALLSQKLKLPDLDFKNLAEDLCGPEIKRYIRLFEVYYAKVKPYLESKEKPAPARPMRRGGTDFSFPEHNGIPGFWLKKMQISSKETADGPLGDMLGKISDFSSAPALVAQPTHVQFEGGFKQLAIQGLKVEATLDHRRPMGRDEVRMNIASFPIADRMLAQSKDYALGFYKAQGAVQMSFLLEGDSVRLELDSLMKQLSWKVEAESERVKSLLDSVFGPMNEVHIGAKAEGPWEDLKWQISSNLVDQLRGALRTALNKQIAEVQEKLKQELDKRLAEEKVKLETRVKAQIQGLQDRLSPVQKDADDTSTLIDGQKNQIQAAVDGKKAEIQKRIEEEKQKQEDKAKDQIKSKLKIPGLGK